LLPKRSSRGRSTRQSPITDSRCWRLHDFEVGLIGGYRVVRRLGAGERSEVWLGRAETPRDTGESATANARDDTGLVAIKVYREDTASDTVDRELTALTRMASPHIVGVVDAAA